MDWATAATVMTGMICGTTLLLAVFGSKSPDEALHERVEELEEQVYELTEKGA